MQVNKIEIEVPTGEDNGRSFLQKWVSGFRLNPRQAQELRRLKRGLAAEDAVMESGRSVESSAQVFQWLLDEITRSRTALAESPGVLDIAVGHASEATILPGAEQLNLRRMK